MISKREFDILCLLEASKKKMSQRDLARSTGASLGSINKDIKTLEEKTYVSDGRITMAGITALEPFRVQRAIFIAAGFGSRLVPITLNTPKPLIRVGGKRIIDTMIDAVLEAGIEEIYIVRGYLADHFDQLLKKYPQIKFVDNPDYNESNNISSAMKVRDLYGNSYVFDGDLLLYNKDLICKYQYSSNYLGIEVERTDEWCFKTRNKKIVGVTIGGRDGYEMLGISYWSKEDGAKFADHIEEVYQSPGGRQRFWDDVILNHYLDEYDLSVRPCSRGDIVEIDTFRELKEIDKTYDV